MHTKFQHINVTFSTFPDLNQITTNVNFKVLRVQELTQLDIEDHPLPMAGEIIFGAASVISSKSDLLQMLSQGGLRERFGKHIGWLLVAT